MNLLENLKTDVQKLDPETIFSQERQRLNNELRSLYTDVQMDTGFSNEERERYLGRLQKFRTLPNPL